MAMTRAPRVAALFEQAGFEQVETRMDLAGQERVTLGRRSTTAA
jgi:methylase of polypeptide subunit release factors